MFFLGPTSSPLLGSPSCAKGGHAGQKLLAVAALDDPVAHLVQILPCGQVVEQAGKALRRPGAELQRRLAADEPDPPFGASLSAPCFLPSARNPAGPSSPPPSSAWRLLLFAQTRQRAECPARPWPWPPTTPWPRRAAPAGTHGSLRRGSEPPPPTTALEARPSRSAAGAPSPKPSSSGANPPPAAPLKSRGRPQGADGTPAAEAGPKAHSKLPTQFVAHSPP